MADEESPDVAGPVSHTFDAISGLYDQYGDSKTGKAMGLAGSGVAAGAAIASGDPNQVAKTTVGIGAGAAGAGAVAAFTGPGVIAVVGGVAVATVAENFYDQISDPDLDPDGGFNGKNAQPRGYGSANVPNDNKGYAPDITLGGGITTGNAYSELDQIAHENSTLGRATQAPISSTRPQARPTTKTINPHPPVHRVSTQGSTDGGKGGGGSSTPAARVAPATQDTSGRDGGKGGGGGNDASDTMTGRSKSSGGFLGGGLFGGRQAGSGSEIGFSGTNAGGGFWGGIFGGNSSGSGTGTGTGETGEGEGPDGGGGGAKPVLLDLNRDGLELNFDRTAQFDIDGDGFREGMTWAGSNDGILAVDLSSDGTLDGAGDGVINQADEIAFANWGGEGVTDMQALAQARDANDALIFDSNGDGHLNAADKHWKAMKVFQDLDQDGVSDAGEVQSLEDWGITDIALFYDDGSEFADHSDDHVYEDGSRLSGTSSITQYGEVVEGVAHDMTLGYDTMGAREFLIQGQTMIEYEDGRIVNKATGELVMQLTSNVQGGHGADVLSLDEEAPESLAQTAERRAQQNWGMITGAVAAGAVATQLAAQDQTLPSMQTTEVTGGQLGQLGPSATLEPLTPRVSTNIQDINGASNAAQLNIGDSPVSSDVDQPPQTPALDAGALSEAQTVSDFAQLQDPLTNAPSGETVSQVNSVRIAPERSVASLDPNLYADSAFTAAHEEVRIANDPHHHLRNERGPIEIWTDIQKQRALEAEQAADAGLSIEAFRESQEADVATSDPSFEAAALSSAPQEMSSEEVAEAMAIIRSHAPDPVADQIRMTNEFELTQAATELFNAGHEIPSDLTLDMARDLLVQMNGPALSAEDVPALDPVAIDLMRMEQAKLSLSKPQDQGSVVVGNTEETSPFGLLVPPAA